MAVSDRGTAKQNQIILKPRGASEEPDESEETRGSPDEPEGPDGGQWTKGGLLPEASASCRNIKL